ncbi:MAG: NTP transferase domain-containing protein, partial [Actinomycetia bacterium]|nr:NTP transferase domain-containing protein [Actinomycetes bacterium]
MDLAVIILAAGKGERMKSSFPKVLHNVCFRAMIHYPFKASQKLKPKKTIVVIGKNGKEINKRLEGKYEVVFQKEPRGTGDAVLKAEKAIKGFEGNVLVLCGDAPLITESTLKGLMNHHTKKRADVTILTCDFDNPYGYGRIVRGEKGKLLKVVEEKDASKKEKQIREINSGTYVFNKKKLFQNLKKIRPNNKQKEYYLTDIVELFCSKGLLVEAHKASNEKEVKGINTREELAEVEKIMRYRINKVFMEKGVTIIEPFLTFIDPEVKIGKDTIVLPMTYIEGNVKIGERCKIGPSTQILNSQIGNECEISCSLIKESKLFNKVNIGPF